MSADPFTPGDAMEPRVGLWRLHEGMLADLAEHPHSPRYRHTRDQYQRLARVVAQGAAEIVALNRRNRQLEIDMGRAEQAIDKVKSDAAAAVAAEQAKTAVVQSQLDSANARVAALTAEPKYDAADESAIDGVLGPATPEPAAGGTDTAALPTLSIADASVSPGTANPVQLSFTVALSAASASDVTVQYGTVGGTAHPSVDYTDTAGTLTIPTGSTTATIAVPVPPVATLPTSPKTLTVTLSAPTGATLGTPATATGTIEPAPAAGTAS